MVDIKGKKLRAIKSIILFTITVFAAFIAPAQNNLRFDRALEWDNEKRMVNVTPGVTKECLAFRGAILRNDDYLPLYSDQFLLPANQPFRVELRNAVFQPVRETVYRGVDIGNQIEIRKGRSIIRKQAYAVVSFVPLRRNSTNGQLEKLVSFELEIILSSTRAPQVVSSRRSGGSTNSVLSSGTWFKIAVDQDGVYRIDRNLLESMGINTDNLNATTMGIFGNGGGMLPEKNDDFRYEDLQENAIFFFGDDDGSFDDGDYILFYGQGPDRWVRDEGTGHYHHQKNIYSDKTYYFLTTDRGTGKRISPQPSSSLSPNVTVDAFDDYAFREDELDNLLGSGREWYGEFFDVFTNNRQYSFSFENRVPGSEVYLNTEVIGRSPSSAITFNVSVNNTSVLNINLGTIIIAFDRLFAQSEERSATFTPTGNTLTVDYDFVGGSDARGWLNYVELNVRRQLNLSSSRLLFRDATSVGPGNVARYVLSSATEATVWEVTDPINVRSQLTTLTGSQREFVLPADSLREFIAFREGGIFPSSEVEYIGPVENQNLHNTAIEHPDMLIVTHPDFLSEANRLADYHREEQGLEVIVMDVFKIYNEFSSGAQDITAIRDMVKMFYDRAGSDPDLLPRYLLLFGDGSFDYKNLEFSAEINSNFVPCFQSDESLHPIFSYTSDDYFGFLDDGEGGNINVDTLGIDIAIGRLPVKNLTEARVAVDKILRYVSPEAFGNWRNVLTFVADDEDGNVHINDADDIAEKTANNYPIYNIDKIYLDAFEQVSGSGGERYPDVNQAINNRIFQGTFMVNYTGHGSETSWAKERVLGETEFNTWENLDALPLFVTATCSFSRYDDPGRTSAGEKLFLKADGGAIALVTTVRLVFSFSNRQINEKFFDVIFEPLDGRMPALGEAVMQAKNLLTVASPVGDGENNRKFTLLGDPALTLAYPTHNVVTTQVNDLPVSEGADTLKALQKVTIKGEIRDQAGNKLDNYNGIVFPTIYDKESLLATLVNDPGKSNLKNFNLQKNIIYRGKASINNGDFSFTFIVPKDISFSFGNGKISYYAQNEEEDAAGFNEEVIIGGTADSIADDDGGPDVTIFMNDEKFAFGGITDESPLMLVKLQDESGINTVGTGIGHDITATIDDDLQNTVILNDFYEAELDNFQAGEVRYLLDELEEGRHSITVKAWDVYNNSGEGYTEFIVAESAELALSHVLNYPNPFTTQTTFMFEHNRPGDLLQVKVEIYTVSGKLVKTILSDIVTNGFRSDQISWNGLDDYGDKIGRGVYVYKLSVRSLSDNSKAHEFEKLVLLR